jgi:pyridoxal phosphate enzyme (YggS family)
MSYEVPPMPTEIALNIEKLRAEIPTGIKLIAVSKTKPVELLQQAYDAGHRAFGENYVQEITEKQPHLPPDIEWHFIGHLQSNKVKYIAPFVHCIHAVDSEKLLMEIEKQGVKNNRKIHCLIQVHIAEEETKFGLSIDEAYALLQKIAGTSYSSVIVEGLMGMASFTEDENRVRSEFRSLKNLFDRAKKELFPNNTRFSQLSMGMSGDWKIAVEEGSTMIRIGSAIFGHR